MISLLEKLPEKELVACIPKGVYRNVTSLLEGEPTASRHVLARILTVLYGDEVLAQKKVRRKVLMLLEPEALAELASKHAGKAFPKAYDNAIALSALSWGNNDFTLGLLQTLGLPLNYALKGNIRLPTTETVSPDIKDMGLFPYQEDIKNLALSHFRAGKGAQIVQMPTGTGKTRTALAVLLESILETPNSWCVLWLAHTEELCEQAIQAFRAQWRLHGDGTTTIARAWSGRRPDAEELERTFLVSTYQTMSGLCEKKDDYYSAVHQKATILVADEAHLALAPTYRRLIQDLKGPKRWLLGLTATPGRTRDGVTENTELANLFDKNLVPAPGSKEAISIPEFQKKGILSKLVKKPLYTSLSFSAEKTDDSDFSAEFLHKLGDDQARNKKLLSTIQAEADKGHSILIFSCSVEHSNILAVALTMAGPAYEAYAINHNTNAQLRRSLIEDFRQEKYNILINYGVLATGFDAPNIDTLIIARPTTSIVLYSQMLGRGLRGEKVGGREYCTLIDVQDNLDNYQDMEAVYNYFSEYYL